MDKSLKVLVENLVAAECDSVSSLPITDVHHPFNYRLALRSSLARADKEYLYDGALKNLHALRDAFVRSPECLLASVSAKKNLTNKQRELYEDMYNSTQRGDILALLSLGISFGSDSDEMAESVATAVVLISDNLVCDYPTAEHLLPSLMFSLD